MVAPAGDASLTRRIDRVLELAGLPPLQRSAWIEVDIDRLIGNARALADHSSPAMLGVVVKADGYGHGLEMAGRCAVAGGARWLCVADAAEATRLRDDGYRGRILVLYPVPPAMLGELARLEVDVTIGSVDEAASLSGALAAGDPILAVHLEVDTGMTRGGVRPEGVVAAVTTLAAIGSVRHVGTWTHLAAPEHPETTAAQLERFHSVLRRLSESGLDPGAVHAAASGGLLATDTGDHTMVRPGLAFYGVDPGAGPPLPAGVLPALAVRAHPVRMAAVPAGTEVGYAGTWTAKRDSVIVTLPIGYADGWSRSSSPGGTVLVDGRRAPLVGRVSSDSITIDVTEIAGVSLDSEFTLLGAEGDNEITADDVAVVRGTISWEVLQQLGGRLSRVYTSKDSPVALRLESARTLLTPRSRPSPTIDRYRRGGL